MQRIVSRVAAVIVVTLVPVLGADLAWASSHPGSAGASPGATARPQRAKPTVVRRSLADRPAQAPERADGATRAAAAKGSSAAQLAGIGARRVEADGAALVGAGWAGAMPDRIESRAQALDGGWSSWVVLDLVDPTGAPSTASEPVWVGESRAVEFRASREGADVTSQVTAVLVQSPTDTTDVQLAGAVDPVALAGPGSPDGTRDGTASVPSAGPGAAPGRSLAEVDPPAAPFAASLVGVRSPMPIYSRADWGADESLVDGTPSYASQVSAVVVHHTDTSNNYSPSDVPAMIRSIYSYHVLTRGWMDIGYNALVDRFGRVWEGRGGGIDRPVVGAHTLGFNSGTVGVSMLGTFSDIAPPAETTTAVAQFVAWRLSLAGISDPTGSTVLTSRDSGSRFPAGTAVTLPRVMGHRDANYTECPGNAAYPLLPSIRTSAASFARSLPAQQEVYARPASGVFAIAGHGFGHGRGMSQWGAYGAALQGVSYQNILGFYYPGTSMSTAANSSIRIQLSADPGFLRVQGEAGLSVTTGAGVVYALPTDQTQWRVRPTGTGLAFEGLQGGAWAAYPLGAAETPGPLTFAASDGLVRMLRADDTSVDYRGALSGLATGASATSLDFITTVDTLPLESYLRGVVPRESPASWPAQALDAQAVAARTYAASARARHATEAFDTCDTTACQVFGGTTRYTASGVATQMEAASSDAAVTATAGVILSYGGGPALTEFSSSDGGWTVAGSAPYLTAKWDPWDGTAPGDTQHSWTAQLPTAAVEAAYPSIGTLQAITVTSRTGNGEWGGRIVGAVLTGSAGTVSVSGEQMRSIRPYPTYADGLRSSWWVVPFTDAQPAPWTLSAGQSLWSAGHTYVLSMQTDGNLVVYNAAGVAQWSTSTLIPGSYATLQTDGNLVVYNAHGYPLWASMTFAVGAQLRIQDDGNLVVYTSAGAPLWDRLGYTRHPASTFAPPREVVRLDAGQSASSLNGAARLAMQTDGNLVVYDSAGRARWASSTFTPGSYMVVQPDGNLVVYRPSGAPAWAAMVLVSGTYLVLQDDGNVVLYAPGRVAMWDALGYTKNAGKRFP